MIQREEGKEAGSKLPRVLPESVRRLASPSPIHYDKPNDNLRPPASPPSRPPTTPSTVAVAVRFSPTAYSNFLMSSRMIGDHFAEFGEWYDDMKMDRGWGSSGGVGSILISGNTVGINVSCRSGHLKLIFGFRMFGQQACSIENIWQWREFKLLGLNLHDVQLQWKNLFSGNSNFGLKHCNVANALQWELGGNSNIWV